MKIVHIYKDFDPPVRGGIERHMALMCRFQRQWAEVEALTCARTAHTRIADRAGTRVVEVAEWGRFQSTPVSPAFPLHLRRLRADVCVVHMPNPAAELGWLLARPKGVLAARYHADVVRQATAMRFYAPFQRQFLRRADIILPSSQCYLETSPMLQTVVDRCRVIPLGIVAEDFEHPGAEKTSALRERYGGPFVFFAGRHRYYKGIDFLVRAAGAIHAPVVIAGEGPERKRLESLAAELGQPIAFPGELSQEDLVAHLHACAVFVYPSVARSEAFGIAILEAHACGKPVVATRLGTGTEYANLDGLTGYNVAPCDSGALADAVNRLLDGDGAAMGARARQRVMREFSAADVARREFEAYAEVLERRNRAAE